MLACTCTTRSMGWSCGVAMASQILPLLEVETLPCAIVAERSDSSLLGTVHHRTSLTEACVCGRWDVRHQPTKAIS